MKKSKLFLVMSAFMVSLVALVAYSPPAKAFVALPEQKFTVENQDIAVKVIQPKNTAPSTAEHAQNHLALTGAQVAICYPDRYELVSAQCQWDGVSERNRYAYTLYMKNKGAATSIPTLAFSINVGNFSAVHLEKSGAPPVVMKVSITPADHKVAFEALPMKEIMAGANPKAFLLSSTK